ncbi:MAG: 23S rRNA (adenine(2503)-C(2))-methyltransferase RlmN [Clostridia bacterium]|nr:23S rRNA (adenine(2503)-C(2))-methyltransferase RlmN [Clostridia bacterium]
MNIYGKTLKMLEDYFKSNSENPAKAKIVFKAIYKEKVSSFFDIKNLSLPVLTKLSNDFTQELPGLIKMSESDEACKYLFRLTDGHTIETVLMKHDYGNGVCVSTQVGCNMNCVFCESGKLKKVRNLEVHEMVGQLLYLTDILHIPVSHVVLMGIGEPFDNYENVTSFIEIITEQLGLAIAARHVTISTSGITPKMLAYAKRQNLNSLAVSLHAPNDELRNQLMPINKKYPITGIIDAAKRYTENCNKKVTFAYIMIKGMNDSPELAHELAALLRGLNCYVNLIPYNKTRSTNYEPSDKEQIAIFFDILKQHGINVTVRRKFGTDMDAACGQLSSDYENSI